MKLTLGKIIKKISRLFNNIRFLLKGIDYKKINSVGFPLIKVDGTFLLRGRMNMVNTFSGSTLGINRRCKITIYRDATLEINGVVSMSNTTIVCTKHIVLGNNVMIGGGTTIVDSDFHTMDYRNWNTPNDERLMKRKDVVIGNNVFIGLNSIILKGVTIGDGAIIAANSLVNKDIPKGEIWGGNPAVFIQKNKIISQIDKQ